MKSGSGKINGEQIRVRSGQIGPLVAWDEQIQIRSGKISSGQIRARSGQIEPLGARGEQIQIRSGKIVICPGKK